MRRYFSQIEKETKESAQIAKKAKMVNSFFDIRIQKEEVVKNNKELEVSAH